MPVRERVITGLRVALAVVSAGSVRLGASGSGTYSEVDSIATNLSSRRLHEV